LLKFFLLTELNCQWIDWVEDEGGG
jgi:hypothetical protein